MKLSKKTLAMAMVLIAALGCDNRHKKAEVRKNLKPEDTLSPQDQEIAALVKASSECLNLADLLKLMGKRTNDLVTIYPVDMDLGVMKDGAFTPTDDYTRAKYLLGNNATVSIESTTGGKLLSSPYVGKLLAVNVQDACNAVTFNAPPKDPNSTTPNTYTLTTADGGATTKESELLAVGSQTEKRTYRMNGTRILYITVDTPLDNVTSCSGKPESMVQRVQYAVSLEGINKPLRIRRSFAKFLAATLRSLPKDLDARLKQPASPAIQPTNNNAPIAIGKNRPAQPAQVTPAMSKDGLEWISFNRTVYLEIENSVQQKQYKDLKCN